jgi:CheY-like chemotaxis protein
VLVVEDDPALRVYLATVLEHYGYLVVAAGSAEEALAALEAAGRSVRRWPERHHYFGGVSAIGEKGLAADPRRSGAALELPGG